MSRVSEWLLNGKSAQYRLRHKLEEKTLMVYCNSIIKTHLGVKSLASKST